MNFSRGAMPGVSEQPSTSASAAVTFPGPFGDVVNGETTYDADKASDAGVASTGAGSSFVGGGNRPSPANGNGPGSVGSEAQLVSRNHRDGETAPTETRELVATAAPTAPETAGALKMGTNLYDVAWSDEEQRVLENGLQAFAATTHSSLWRYIKCAANLPAKGVRDVALRVRWMRRARGGGVKKRKGGTAGGGSGEDAKANGGGAVPTKPKGKAKAKAKAPAGRIVTRDASGNESSGMNQTAAHTRVANPSTKPRSVFAMPPPGPPGGGGMGVHANGNGPGGVGGMGVGPGPGTHGVSMVPPLARGVGGHIIGGQMHGGPPGYGAMGGGMGTGVLPGPGYNGPGVPYPTHVPGPYPVHPGFGQVPVGMVPQRALHAGAHVLHVPPQRSPVGALEDHGGVGITLGIGAIDPVLHEKLCANAAIVKKLRDDDLLLENRNDGSGSVSAEKKLTPHARLALLGEMRDLIVDVTDTMRATQGIMQRMPQLPVTLNTGLANALLPPPVARRNGIDNGKALISKATRPRTDRKKTQPRPKVTQKGPVSGAGVGKGKGKGKQ